MDCKVLILGSGGLGCEILKNLYMLKVREIHIVDMDTIELTNLNRQFLFNDDDIGKPKATVAASYINNLCKKRGDNPIVTPYVQDLTNFEPQFFKQFDFIISGLDAISPRRFINEMIVYLTKITDYDICIPLIDGGSEGFKGHIKTIIPGVTACWECSISTLPTQQQTVPMCTIANNPRSLEHVIEYVINVVFQNTQLNFDDMSQVQKILQACTDRASDFNIDTTRLNTQFLLGIIKKIVPSVTSTNTIIAAGCCNELIKIYYDLIDLEKIPNFNVLNGSEGCFSYGFIFERLPDCPVCSCLT